LVFEQVITAPHKPGDFNEVNFDPVMLIGLAQKDNQKYPAQKVGCLAKSPQRRRH
jgi:hypothetical protein